MSLVHHRDGGSRTSGRRLYVGGLYLSAPGCPKGRNACAKRNTTINQVAGPAAGRWWYTAPGHGTSACENRAKESANVSSSRSSRASNFIGAVLACRQEWTEVVI